MMCAMCYHRGGLFRRRCAGEVTIVCAPFLLGSAMQRIILTIPLTDAGPAELAKLVELIATGHGIAFEGAPYLATEPDGVVLLCLPVAVESADH